MTPPKLRTWWATEIMGSEPGNFIASFDQQFIKNISHGEQLRFVALSDLEPLLEALNRIVGMTETWTDEHGQRRCDEIDASKIARSALALWDGAGE